jgi:hypothetical protein
MENRPVLLLVFVIVLSVYLKLTWLAWLLGIVALFMLMSVVKLPRLVAKKATPQGGKEEEILTPVVVTDVGPPPFLYPPDFRMKIAPRWGSTTMYEDAAAGLGAAAGLFGRLFKK